MLAIVWLLVFTAGVVVETTTSRFYLAPIGTLGDKPGSVDASSLSALSIAITGSVPTVVAATGASLGGDAALDMAALRKSLLAVAEKRDGWQKLYDYFICLMCYSPVNIAVLALIAGAMGGSMSNLYASSLTPDERSRLAKSNPLSLQALAQSPWVAAVQGLIAYVCIVAGLYVLVDDPFKSPTPASYTKLAGLMSAVAFAVGYDHTRFGGLLNAIPVPRGGASQGGNHTAANPPADAVDAASMPERLEQRVKAK